LFSFFYTSVISVVILNYVVFITLTVHTVVLMPSASFIWRRESDVFELDTSRVNSEYV
jgi:hypothetical protein